MTLPNKYDYKLDNPVWHSLSESHQKLAVDFDNIKFYHPDYCAFGGFISTENISTQIDEYAKMIDSFYILGEQPQLSTKLQFEKELACLQMVIENRVDIKITEYIEPLTPEHTDALIDLITLVMPGYFRKKTSLLGNYFGIFKNGELVSVAGERMQMNNFIEVSGIVTHPNYTGQGYSKQLVAHTVNNIFNQNKIPFLHVLETNITAIKLYEKTGFKQRRKISFWHISKS